MKQFADKANEYKREFENSTKVLTIQQSIISKTPLVSLIAQGDRALIMAPICHLINEHRNYSHLTGDLCGRAN